SGGLRGRWDGEPGAPRWPRGPGPRCLDGPPAPAPVIGDLWRTHVTERRVAALPSSQDLTGPPCRDEPRVLKGRRGGTDEFLGRGALAPQSPWSEGQGGRPSDKCLVQQHADALSRKFHAAVSAAVNSGPVITPRKNHSSSPVRGAPVDKRGHIRVRLGTQAGRLKPVVPVGSGGG